MRIAILHASAGHGHAQAAASIREGFLFYGAAEKDILLLDSLDETPAWFKKIYTSLYYYSVKHTPRLWGASYALLDQGWFFNRLGYPVRRLMNGWVGRRILARMKKEKPDAILFTHFLAPEVLGHAKKGGEIASLLVTVITDFLPHRFWINPGMDHYWVMSDEGKKIIERWGVGREDVTAGGIPVALRFRPAGRKRECRKKEGLDEDRFTLLITSGSFGLGPTEEVLQSLREFGGRIQVIAVSGKNQNLFAALEKESYPFKMKLYGFVSHMDELMEASDLIVAKPGGATTSESLAKGLPMAVLEPIPGQEAGNARLLRERNAAFFLKHPMDIRTILKAIFDYPAVLAEKKRSIDALAKPDAARDVARFVLDKLNENRP